jgi:hypothetical protein
VTKVLDAPPVGFEAAPEERRRVLSTAPKSLQKQSRSRDAYFREHWGFVQFCKVESRDSPAPCAPPVAAGCVIRSVVLLLRDNYFCNPVATPTNMCFYILS